MFRFATSALLALACRSHRGGVIVNGHTLTREQTRLQLDVLGRWFDFIGLEELASRLARPTQRPFCLLTFDDGKRSNFTEIAPELETRGVPAIFYVTTGPVTTGGCLWFDRHAQLIRKIGRCPDGLELSTLKQLPFDVSIELLDRAGEHYQLAPTKDADDARLMSWDEIRDLARRGFIIGAHGVTHAILTNESKMRAFTEIEESLAVVSAELGAPCRTFAFPNGNHTVELARHATRCGATSVMTTAPTWVDEAAALWRLPRIQLFGNFSPARMQLKLALAARPGLLANPDGTGKNYCVAASRRERVEAEPARADDSLSRFAK